MHYSVLYKQSIKSKFISARLSFHSHIFYFNLHNVSSALSSVILLVCVVFINRQEISNRFLFHITAYLVSVHMFFWCLSLPFDSGLCVLHDMTHRVNAQLLGKNIQFKECSHRRPTYVRPSKDKIVRSSRPTTLTLWLYDGVALAGIPRNREISFFCCPTLENENMPEEME